MIMQLSAYSLLQSITKSDMILYYQGTTTIPNIRRRLMKRSLGAKTIVSPTPVFVVGSYDNTGRPNVIIAV